MTRLQSVERLAAGKVTKWGEHSSVVKLDASFDHGEGDLTFYLYPVDRRYHFTIAEAKSYCRDLIKAEELTVRRLLFIGSSPNGWTTPSLASEDFTEQLYENTKLGVSIDERWIDEKLPEDEYSLECEAEMPRARGIKNFSYNL